MSSNTHLRTGKDYQSCFDSKWYLTENYSEATGTDFNKFVVNSLHKIYSTGQIKGKHLVDIGSGPCIYMVIPAAKSFEEITLSDYSPVNREMLQKWLRKDDDAHDWTSFFQYFNRLDNKAEDSSELEVEVRKKVNKVLQCDVNSINPLYPESFERIDAISTSSCLETACSDVREYTQAMKNVVSLLNKGGKFILMGILNFQFYTVGNEKFKCVSLKMSDVMEAIQNSGLRVLETFEDKDHSEGYVVLYNGLFLILAEKV